ncbi:hypothetical protein IAD21_01826 [Abditibacteriota bacterium]|nr:hypothetical protein IAD21_01826 [Abditibacteriota bacterium]
MGVTFPRNRNVSSRPRDFLKAWSLATLLLLPLMWTWELVFAENGSLSALLLYLPQHLYLILPAMLGVWALLKRRVRVALLNALSLTFSLVFPLGWQLHLPHQPSSATVRLVTFNIQRGEGDERRCEAALHSLNPDIVCLQESGLSTNIALNAIGRHVLLGFPGWNARYAGDVTTLSRFPIMSDHVYPLVGSRRTLETVLQTRSGPMRVLNTHISTTFAGERAPTSQLDRIAVLYETARPSAQARLNQLPAIHKAIDSGDTGTPLVLVGDFNTPPRGHFYGSLAGDLNDAFTSVGNGLGLTFPSRLPLLRIDYVWMRGVRAVSAFVGGPSGSDHRPLITDLEVSS